MEPEWWFRGKGGKHLDVGGASWCSSSSVEMALAQCCHTRHGAVILLSRRTGQSLYWATLHGAVLLLGHRTGLDRLSHTVKLLEIQIPHTVECPPIKFRCGAFRVFRPKEGTKARGLGGFMPEEGRG